MGTSKKTPTTTSCKRHLKKIAIFATNYYLINQWRRVTNQLLSPRQNTAVYHIVKNIIIDTVPSPLTCYLYTRSRWLRSVCAQQVPQIHLLSILLRSPLVIQLIHSPPLLVVS